MNSRRTAQLLLFLITLGLGIAGLFLWQPSGKLAAFDTAFSPLKSEGFSVGAHIEDNSSDDSRDKVIREIAPPSHSALNYLLCEIDDDPEQLNAFGTYHPTDLAITLGNLNNQGIKHLFISTHLHWPALDLEEKSTLATAMKGYDSVVVAAPVRRNLASEPITAAFHRSSTAVADAIGNAELLPLVNSLSVAPDIVFPENTYAGFSALESEKVSDAIPLIARWHDRIIFSAPLLALMQRSNVTPEQIYIHLGKYIRIGNTGNIIPIDDFGLYQPNAAFSAKPPARKITSASSGDATIIGATQSFAVLTATGENSSQFEAVGDPFNKLSQLAYTPRVSTATTLSRIPLWLECILIVDAALLAVWLFIYSGIRRHIYYLIAVAGTWLAFVGIYQAFHYWSPISLYLLPLGAGWLIATVLSKFQITNFKS